ncbi:MAG: hypothetical protein R2939_07015 [Kofleriaceae bacterium]
MEPSWAWAAMAVIGLSGGCGRLGFEGDAERDAAPADVDAAAPLARCDPRLTPTTLAMYTFDRGDGTDATGAHDGSWEPGAASVAGPCGAALATTGTGHVAVADDPAWQLAAGTVDLELTVAAGAMLRGLITRDASGELGDGHFSIVLSEENILVVRLQRGGTNYLRCGDLPLVAGATHHVAVAFGAPNLTLWVDGVEQLQRLDYHFITDEFSCQAAIDLGIDDAGTAPGNHNQWVLGGANFDQVDGGAGATNPLDGSVVDHVRIRRGWHPPGAFE